MSVNRSGYGSKAFLPEEHNKLIYAVFYHQYNLAFGITTGLSYIANPI